MVPFYFSILLVHSISLVGISQTTVLGKSHSIIFFSIFNVYLSVALSIIYSTGNTDDMGFNPGYSQIHSRSENYLNAGHLQLAG